MKITMKTMLAVLVPVALVITLLCIALYSHSAFMLKTEVKRQFRAVGIRADDAMARDVESIKGNLTTMLINKSLEEYFMYLHVREMDYVEDARASLEETFVNMAQTYPFFGTLRIFRNDGTGVVNVTDKKATHKYTDPTQTHWFQSALGLEKGQTFVSRVHLCPEHGRPSLFVSQAYYYRGRALAVGCIHVHVQTFFRPLLREIATEWKGCAFLIDSTGRVIAHKNPAKVGKDISDLSSTKALIAGKTGFVEETPQHASEPILTYYMPSRIRGIGIVVDQHLHEAMSVGDALKRDLVVIALVTILLLLVLILLVSRKIVLKPVAELSAAADKLARGDFGTRIEIHTNDEIGFLGRAFNKMVEDLQRTTVSRNYVDSIFRSMSDPLIVCSMQKKIQTVNQAALDLLGYTREELIDQSCWMLFDKDSWAQYEENCRRLQESEAVLSHESTFLTKDGEEIPVLYSVAKIHEGNIMGIVGIAKDIREQKRSAREKEQLQRQLQEALTRVLGGFIPICAACKKIRDTESWVKLEAYVETHSEAQFTHGLCPECARRLYPDYDVKSTSGG